MNTSQFMDKQILGLSGSGGGGGEFFDLMEPRADHSQPDKKEEILPSYDFQPIRTVAGLDGPRPSWGSADSKIGASALKYAGISEPCEVAKVSHEKEKGAYDVVTVADIDRTMKKHADNLLHALEGLSSRLSQLEGRTRHLETSVDELKVSVGNSNGSTDGKLRQLENILREVQTSVQVLCDKQEIAETQLKLSKLQTSKADDQPSPMTNTGQLDSKQQPLPPLTQPIQPSLQQLVIPPPPHSLPAQPAPNAPPPPPPHNPVPSLFPPQPTQSQIPSLPSLPRESYFPPPSQPTEATHQQYQMPPSQQPQQTAQPQHYQSPPQLPQYSQPPPQPPQPVNPPPQLQPPLPHHSEEPSPYVPAPLTYPPGIRQPSPLNQPSTGPPPPQQFYGPNPGMYEPPLSRPSSGQLSYSSGYGPPVGPNFSDSYPYSGSPSHYSSSMKTSPFAASGGSSSGSSSYPRLPTAQILPQAQPTGSGSGGPAGNRMPIDDVVDKVATMGFSRDQVRAAVRKLTENGQSVDLNVVLDKLMNDGQIQPQKGWFGR